MSESRPKKSLPLIEPGKFGPGDRILLKRGSVFQGQLKVTASGSAMVLADSWDGAPRRVRLVSNMFCSEEESEIRIDPASDKVEFADNQWYVGELGGMKARILGLLRVNSDRAYPILLIDTLRLHKLFIEK